MERRLAAILAADVVGYSRLMERDEAGTFERLRQRRTEVVEPAILRHHGRVFKLMGDGLLAEFGSVVDAVECAAAIQQSMAEANRDMPDEGRIALRIGVHVGDVIVESEDRHGDAVNIAARLQEVAEPGGVCVSRAVVDHARHKVAFGFEPRGEQRLKNIAEPVAVYAIRLDGAPEKQAPPLPDKPSIAVLPFNNLSGDPEQDYLADGLTEDIITGLSRVSALFVIARNSVFTYKGRAVPVAQVARELSVRYVLEGSVRKSGSRVRITAQLVEATAGHHVWAEKFDREFVELFDLQDEITQAVVATTQTQILLAEGDPGRQSSRLEMSLWSLVNRAMWRIHDLTAESLAEARLLAEQALKIDPKCGPAWRCLSIAAYHQAHMLSAADYDATLSEALDAAERSVRLDKNDECAHWNFGNVLVALRQHDRAIAAFERALELNPNHSVAHGSLGTALCYAGRPAEGILKNKIAIRSDPLNPSIFFRYTGLALGHYLIGDYESAAEWARRSLQRNREWYLGHVYRIASLAELGRIEEAQEACREYLRLFPCATISELRRLPLKHERDLERLCASLRKAGLPE